MPKASRGPGAKKAGSRLSESCEMIGPPPTDRRSVTLYEARAEEELRAGQAADRRRVPVAAADVDRRRRRRPGHRAVDRACGREDQPLARRTGSPGREDNQSDSRQGMTLHFPPRAGDADYA